MKCKAFWTNEADLDEIGDVVVNVDFAHRGRGGRLNRERLFKSAVTALKAEVRDSGLDLTRMFLAYIWTDAGQVINFKEYPSNSVRFN